LVRAKLQEAVDRLSVRPPRFSVKRINSFVLIIGIKIRLLINAGKSSAEARRFTQFFQRQYGKPPKGSLSVATRE